MKFNLHDSLIGQLSVSRNMVHLCSGYVVVGLLAIILLMLSPRSFAKPFLPKLHSGFEIPVQVQNIRLNVNVDAAPLNSFVYHDRDLSDRVYPKILLRTSQNRLWYHGNELTQSGLMLLNILKDIGWLGDNHWESLPVDQVSRDRILTQGIYFLLQSSRFDQGNMHENPVNTLVRSFKLDQELDLIYRVLPRQKGFWQLRKHLHYYQQLQQYDWPSLDPDFVPKLGQRHQQIGHLRHKLVLLGDLPSQYQTQARFDVFDVVAEDALQRFQARHGLVADGKLGPVTHLALGISPKQRTQQIKFNLLRWFELPRSFKGQSVHVNIPSYQLQYRNNGRTLTSMKVIVGNKNNPTPVLSTQINRLTVNPTWTPTPKIIMDDLVEEYKQDPSYLSRKDFQLVKGYWKNKVIKEINSPDYDLLNLPNDFRLVQAPGSFNPLGKYRFNMPNGYAIYLHDTPGKWMFRKPYRALSHGCIRLEQPELLAEILVSQSEKSDTEREIINQAKKQSDTRMLYLASPVPVYVTYHTAWVDDSGEMNFNQDIYNLDNYSALLTQFKNILSNPVITLSQINL
ncbi:hypothetical protein FE810_14685 [Thalassotalea litorea]|uniref:L,D-TPase catalytic domain-containing protein n=1 Tax=Thalassotalea litorea TaxID=2020715 RepID=A0A5R9IFS9_9GAMM|nr:L,D-transpeptidase family protein [Thalassotalea litorea]TLU61480.1 hypothetical protein FE810_14685 [Thalassotalea litorea]